MHSFRFLSLFFVIFLHSSVICHEQNGTMKFELIHRHELELQKNPNLTFRTSDLAYRDHLRNQMISQRLRRRLNTGNISLSYTLFSGVYSGFGEYYVKFRVGSPSQNFLLVADTGSDLTWIKCEHGCQNCTFPGQNHRRRAFKSDKSSTFQSIGCLSETCKRSPFSLINCSNSCTYDYSYIDGSRAGGILARESATITLNNGEKTRLNGIIVGCTTSTSGSLFSQVDGVLGLSRDVNSILAIFGKRFGNKLSYCLMNHLSPKNITSSLVIGNGTVDPHKLNQKVHTSRLILDSRIGALYAVAVTGITIGELKLNISSEIWDVERDGGVILDSGTGLTMLAKPAYEAVVTALSNPMKRFKKLELKPLEFCYNTTVGFNESDIPKLIIHFEGSARLEPPVKSYIIDATFPPNGVKCIGFVSTTWPGVSVIGNILQQNFLWEFDFSRNRFSFQPSSCTS